MEIPEKSQGERDTIKKRNITSITELKTGQLIVTIPRAIGHAMRFEDKDKIEWLLDKGDLIVRKV